MAILKVARLGHPVLREVAKAVDPAESASAEVQQLIDDLVDTMRDYDGAGLAAPQVHISRRVVVFEIQKNHPRYPESPEVPLTVLVNPQTHFKRQMLGRASGRAASPLQTCVAGFRVAPVCGSGRSTAVASWGAGIWRVFLPRSSSTSATTSTGCSTSIRSRTSAV